MKTGGITDLVINEFGNLCLSFVSLVKLSKRIAQKKKKRLSTEKIKYKDGATVNRVRYSSAKQTG